MTSAKPILAFDVYGTLLDTNSLTKSLSEHTTISDEKVAELSAYWRRLQLEYTFRLNSMGEYIKTSLHLLLYSMYSYPYY